MSLSLINLAENGKKKFSSHVTGNNILSWNYVHTYDYEKFFAILDNTKQIDAGTHHHLMGSNSELWENCRFPISILPILTFNTDGFFNS